MRLFSDCWPLSAPRPPPSSEFLVFFMMHAYYYYDDIRGTVVEIHGNREETNESVCLRMYGCDPHFYFRLPPGWSRRDVGNFVGLLDKSVCLSLKEVLKIRKKSKYYNKALWKIAESSSKRAVKSWKIIRAAELVEYVGEEEVDFVDVKVATPQLVKIMREFIDAPKGNTDEKNFVPRWIDTNDKTLRAMVRKIRLFEADVDFIIRFCVDLRWKPCNWFSVPFSALEWKTHASQDRLNESYGHWVPKKVWKAVPRLPQKLFPEQPPVPLEKERRSRSNFEGIVHYSKISKSTKVREDPNFRNLVFDIETKCQFGASFPDPNRDPVIAITADLYNEKDPTNVRPYTFGLRDSIRTKKCYRLFWFNDERDLLLAWFYFVLEVDPDSIVDHNGSGFDFPFLIKRAKVLGIKDYDKIGRSLLDTMYCKDNVNKGKKKSSCVIPGRLHIDTMRIEQEIGGIRVGLNACAERYLKSETKDDLPYWFIDVCQKTKKLRKVLRAYGEKDTELTRKITQKKGDLPMTIITSSLSGIMPQTCLNRSQGVKMEGGLRSACNKEGAIKMLKIIKDHIARRDANRPSFLSKTGNTDKGYEGATVLEPIAGYYESFYKIITLDFASLYPSIIRWLNLCYSTLVRQDTIDRLGLVEGEDYIRTYDTELVTNPDGSTRIKRTTHPDYPCFLTPKRRKGLLPALEEELLAQRKAFKRQMFEAMNILSDIKKKLVEDNAEKMGYGRPEEGKEDEWWENLWTDLAWKAFTEADKQLREAESEYKIWDLKQLAIKIWMNSIYGLTGDRVSTYFQEEIASTVTREGRGLILRGKEYVEKTYTKKNGYEFDSQVIYGDTDSIMIKVYGVSMARAFELGKQMAKETTAIFGSPAIIFEFEKIYSPYLLIRKKNYAGCMWTAPNTKPTMDVKGLEFKKFQMCDFLKKACTEGMRISVMPTSEDREIQLIAHLRKSISHLLNADVPVNELVEAQRMSKLLVEYGKPKYNKKTGKFIKGSLTLGVKLLKEKWEQETKKRKRRNLPLPPPPAPGDIAEWIICRPIGVLDKVKKGDRIRNPLDVVNNNIPVNYDAYIKSLEEKTQIYFVPVIHTLRKRKKPRTLYSYFTTKNGDVSHQTEKEENIRPPPLTTKEKNTITTEILYGSSKKTRAKRKHCDAEEFIRYYTSRPSCPFCGAEDIRKNLKNRKLDDEATCCTRAYREGHLKRIEKKYKDSKKSEDSPWSEIKESFELKLQKRGDRTELFREKKLNELKREHERLKKNNNSAWFQCKKTCELEPQQARDCISFRCKKYGERTKTEESLKQCRKKLSSMAEEVARTGDLCMAVDIEDLICAPPTVLGPKKRKRKS